MKRKPPYNTSTIDAGRRGGLASAARLTSAQRSARATKAANARWKSFTPDAMTHEGELKMPKIIGTTYGVIFGHMIGTLCDEFGVAEVENAFTAVMSAIRTVADDPATADRVQAATEQHTDAVRNAIRAASDKTSS